jgi:uncharacterized membrane protein YqjE
VGEVAMFADVWTKRDFVAAGFMLVGLLLVVAGQAFDWRLAGIAGFVVMLVGAAVLVAWRVVGGPDHKRKRPDGI